MFNVKDMNVLHSNKDIHLILLMCNAKGMNVLNSSKDMNLILLRIHFLKQKQHFY